MGQAQSEAASAAVQQGDQISSSSVAPAPSSMESLLAGFSLSLSAPDYIGIRRLLLYRKAESSVLRRVKYVEIDATFDNLLFLAITEAAAYGSDGNESLEANAQRALECPCIADLRNGPCGGQFSDAFLCFLRSTAEEKGSDCVHPFVALQNCINANPNAFSKDILDEAEEEREEQPAQEYKIIPPIWSREPQSPKPKL